MTLKQHIGDAVRLALLKKYGGLWMDANIILLKDNIGEFCFDKVTG